MASERVVLEVEGGGGARILIVEAGAGSSSRSGRRGGHFLILMEVAVERAVEVEVARSERRLPTHPFLSAVVERLQAAPPSLPDIAEGGGDAAAAILLVVIFFLFA